MRKRTSGSFGVLLVVGLFAVALATSLAAPGSRAAALSDPATGTCSPTGSMTPPRGYQTATLLPNGQVLVAGGENSSGALSSAELFNPATDTFSPTGSMNVTRAGQNATLLQDGQVLVAGGSCCGTSAELYNPTSGSFSLTGSMNFPRSGPLAALLPNGQVLEVC